MPFEHSDHLAGMALALAEADRALACGEPPFGVVILDSTGKVVAATFDEVGSRGDMTAHAEVLAVRRACEIRGPDLSDCILYTTCEPCPMCFTAAWLARVNGIVYATTMTEVNEILGDRQRELRMPATALNRWSDSMMPLHFGVMRNEALERFRIWQNV